MSQTDFLSRLGDQSWNVRIQGDNYVVLVPVEPINADKLWLAVADDDEVETYSDAMELLPIRTVVTFWWDDGMPASTADVEVFDTADRTYITRPNDDLDLGWIVLAAIEPAQSGDAFAAFLADYLADNGLSYRAEIFGSSLPNRIEVFDEALAPRDAVARAIEAWGAWALPGGGEPGWVDEYVDAAYEIASD